MNTTDAKRFGRWLVAAFFGAAVATSVQSQPLETNQSVDPLSSGPDGCDRQADCVAPDNADPVWIEKSVTAVHGSAQDLAVWVDSFFGTTVGDSEASVSRLRLRLDYDYDEDDGSDLSGGVRGKVYLPNLDDRLSIVFASDESVDEDDLFPGLEDTDTNTGLQYDFRRSVQEALSLTASFNSSLDFRSSLRYRKTFPLSDSWSTRLTERLYYRQEDGFGLLSRVDLDYSRNRNGLIRWTNDADYGESTDGVDWRSILGYWQRLSDKQALNYFASVKGATDPESWVKSYGFGVKYRRNLWKPWFFVELEPAHDWKKNDFDDSRHSVWSVMFRLEFLEQAGDRQGLVD